MRSSDRPARWRQGLGVAAMLLTLSACAAAPVSVRSDVEGTQASAERTQSWRNEVTELEARRIRGVDVRAYERTRSWLDRLEGEDEPEVRALLVAAITGELDVMRTAEKRYGTSGPLGTPAPAALDEESPP